ncbi:unnamed protein product [Meloidogyne enterolobii]|uniref:Uncharacterized protein n=1 Tax=Meloidogyne enterolobii TaxID=390850 RepID=A0ACB0YUG6_MELEN
MDFRVSNWVPCRYINKRVEGSYVVVRNFLTRLNFVEKFEWASPSTVECRPNINWAIIQIISKHFPHFVIF